MTNDTYPKAYENVMITFKFNGEVLTKEGFYVPFNPRLGKFNGYYNSVGKWVPTPDGCFSIPEGWRDGLPIGFHGFHKQPHEIISWQPIS